MKISAIEAAMKFVNYSFQIATLLYLQVVLLGGGNRIIGLRCFNF